MCGSTRAPPGPPSCSRPHASRPNCGRRPAKRKPTDMRADREFACSGRNITHRYRNVGALDNVTIDIPANKMIGVIGPDGVGKSTLLGILAGVRTMQEGEAEVLGGNIDDAKFRTQIAA